MRRLSGVVLSWTLLSPVAGDDGPAENQWSEKFPYCGGERQSPIDLKTRRVQFNRSLMPLHMVNYDEDLELSMTNNGHTGKGYRWGEQSAWETGSVHTC